MGNRLGKGEGKARPPANGKGKGRDVTSGGGGGGGTGAVAAGAPAVEAAPTTKATATTTTTATTSATSAAAAAATEAAANASASASAPATSATPPTTTTIPTHGVSVRHLRSLPVAPTATIYDVCTSFVKPTTAATQSSYADYLLSSPQTKHLVKPKADVFVSYAWAYSWNDVLSALEESGFADAFIWLDVVVVDQHHALGKQVDDWLLTFKSAVVELKHVVFVLAPWAAPTNTKRAWCVFEILAAVDANVVRTVVLPPAQKQDFLAAMVEERLGVDIFMSIFADVNIDRCDATSATDKEAILSLVRDRVDVNDAVLGPLKDFYVVTAESAAAEAERDAWSATSPASPERKRDVVKMLSAVGNLHRCLAHPILALEWHERALALARDAASPSAPNDNDAQVAIVLSNMSSAMMELGRLEEAVTFIRESIDMCRPLATTPVGITGLATSISNLAVYLTAQGKYAESLTATEEALALRRQVLDEDHEQILQSLNNLAATLAKLGRYEEALDIHRDVLVRRERNTGRDHPDVATTLGNIASCLYSMRRAAEAEAPLREALAIRRRALGEDHTDVALSLSDLASCLASDPAKLEEALQMHQEALALRMRVLGSDHPDIATSLSNISATLQSLGRNEEGLEFALKTLEMRRRVFGDPDSHAEVASAEADVGTKYFLLKRYGEALDATKRALEIRRRAFASAGGAHPSIVESLTVVGMCYRAMGPAMRNKALEAHCDALRTAAQVATTLRGAVVVEPLGDVAIDATLRELPDDANVAGNMLTLAVTLYSTVGNVQEARKFGAGALRMRERLLGEDHPLTQQTRRDWGEGGVAMRSS